MLTFRFKFSVLFFLILLSSKVNAQNRISLDTINNAVYIGEFIANGLNEYGIYKTVKEGKKKV